MDFPLVSRIFDSLPSLKKSASKPLDSSQNTSLGLGSMEKGRVGVGRGGLWCLELQAINNGDKIFKDETQWGGREGVKK